MPQAKHAQPLVATLENKREQLPSWEHHLVVLFPLLITKGHEPFMSFCNQQSVATTNYLWFFW